MRRKTNKSQALIPSEYSSQATVIAWAETMRPKFPELDYLHSNGNGVRLSIGAAVKAKRSGQKAGVPDLFLPVKKSFASGLYIEMKKKGGRVSDDQERWKLFLRSQGFRVIVCWSADEAIRELETYVLVT